jgi:hypothetical protein
MNDPEDGAVHVLEAFEGIIPGLSRTPIADRRQLQKYPEFRWLYDRINDSAFLYPPEWWLRHINEVKPELSNPHPVASISPSPSSYYNSVEAFIEDVRRKSVHFVFVYNGHEVVIKFWIVQVAAVYAMPVLRFACYTYDANTSTDAVAEVELREGDGAQSCQIYEVQHVQINFIEEQDVNDINDRFKVCEMKTIMALYNCRKTQENGDHDMEDDGDDDGENDDDIMRMRLSLKIR